MNGNCKSNYIGCMAEKRGVDRSILKLIDAYQYGVYSETESDSFQRTEIDTTPKKIVEIQQKTESLREEVLDLMETRQFDLDKFFTVFEGKDNLDQFTHADLLKAKDGLLKKPLKGAL